MDFADATPGLPSSRTDALSVVVLGFLSAFVGSTPAEGKRLAITTTVLANVWAITSSVLTFRDVYSNPQNMEHHLWLLLIGLLVLTIATSALTLASFSHAASPTGCAFLNGMLLVFAAFMFGLIVLVLAFALGCDHERFVDAALCKHKTANVVGVVVSLGVVGIFWGSIIMACSVISTRGVLHYAYRLHNDQDDDDQPHSFSGAGVTRISALAKACLLCTYWWLVNADLSWDYTVKGKDLNLWVTGQWAKQSAAIANNFFNCLG